VIIFNKQDLANRAPYGQYLLEQAQNTSINATQYQEMVTQTRLIVRKLIRQALSDNQVDIILIHGNMLAPINASAGFPALTMPAGYRETGEPIGITMIGDYLDDPKLISIAYAFEQAANLRKDPVLKNEN
jgi:amidase